MFAVPEKDMAAYEQMRAELEQEYWGKWALIQDENFVQAFDEFEEAIEAALDWFEGSQYHIRQVGIETEVRPSFTSYDAMSQSA